MDSPPQLSLADHTVFMHDIPSHHVAAGNTGASASVRALVGIGLARAAYLVAAAAGLPQHGRDLLVQTQAASHDSPAPAAISLGAVVLVAMTYIGIGSTFTVQAIAEQSGPRVPSVFVHVPSGVGVVLPVFAMTPLIFFS